MEYLWIPSLRTRDFGRPTRGQARCQLRAQGTDHACGIAPSDVPAAKPLAAPPRGTGPGNSASHMVGIEKSAPERMPVGQRDVMVFSLV